MIDALEGFRVAVTMGFIFLSVLAFSNVGHGLLAVPKIMRPRIKFRRRYQMGAFILIGIILSWQSVLVIQNFVFIPTTYLAISSHISILSVVLLLIAITIIQLIGWWNEQVIVKIPLNPDAEERAKNAIEKGREIAHLSKSYTAIISLVLEELLQNNSMTDSELESVAIALKNTHLLNNHIEILHEEIKLLGPLVIEVVKSDAEKQD